MPESVRLREGANWELIRRGSDGELVLQVGRWSDEVAQILRETLAPHISQEGSWESGDPVLPRLVEFAPQIRSLTTSTDPVGDLTLIGELESLETLVLQHPDPGIDYRRLGQLRELRLWDRATLGRAVDAPRLRLLQLWSVKMKNLSDLASMAQLRQLMLTQMGSLTSLAGIEQLPLEALTITYGNRFRSLAPIGALRDLKTLAIDGNRKAEGAEAIAELHRLELLEIESGPVLPSLEVLGSLSALRTINLIGTEIGSGPCSVAPLTRLEHIRQLMLAGRPRSLKNLTDLHRLGELTTLETLRLDRIADLPSISWLRSLRNLRYLAISGTSIRDRDLSPIVDLPALTFLGLDVRGFAPARKTYTPTYEEVLAPSQARRADSERGATASVTRADGR